MTLEAHKPVLKARWCQPDAQPVLAHYTRCPYCGLAIESTLHPDWEWCCEEWQSPEVTAAELASLPF